MYVEDHEEELALQLYDTYLNVGPESLNPIVIQARWREIARKAIQYVKENMNEAEQGTVDPDDRPVGQRP